MKDMKGICNASRLAICRDATPWDPPNALSTTEGSPGSDHIAPPVLHPGESPADLSCQSASLFVGYRGGWARQERDKLDIQKAQRMQNRGRKLQSKSVE